MPGLVDSKTLQRVSTVALTLKRRSNGEAIVRAVLALVLVGLVVLLYQKHDTTDAPTQRTCR